MADSESKCDYPTIVHAQDEFLYTVEGRMLIDLFTAHGTVWLGHGRSEVRQALVEQLGRVWITGGYATPAVETVRAAVNDFLPEGFVLASLATTGMEANELAIRIARVRTARHGLLGFSGAMHGKSFATAALAWDNGDELVIPQVHRIAAGALHDEGRMLRDVEMVLARAQISAVFVEPIHGTTLGWEASREFYRELRALTQKAGALLVYDEVLTGFHRTGPKFRFEDHGVVPDLIVFGKACGNGFPVAGVACREGAALLPRMLMGSTFSNNSLAAVAVTATLASLSALDASSRVSEIERVVQAELGWLADAPVSRIRGAGALWIIDAGTVGQAVECRRALHVAGVCVGHHGHQIRLLPPLTIAPDNLRRACVMVSDQLRKCAFL